MIIWHAPTEPPKEGIDLIVLIKDTSGTLGMFKTVFNGEVFVAGDGLEFINVLAWTEYNMPEWVNFNRKETKWNS